MGDRTPEREPRVASLPDDPDAPFAHRLLLALGMWPSYIEEIGHDELVEAAVKIRSSAHRFPMASEDYGDKCDELEIAREALREIVDLVESGEAAPSAVRAVASMGLGEDTDG